MAITLKIVSALNAPQIVVSAKMTLPVINALIIINFGMDSAIRLVH